MGVLNRHKDSPRQFLLYLDHFIDSIECVNVFIYGMANLAVLGTSPSCTCCRTDKLTHWWAISNYSVEIVPAVSEMIMQNSLLHRVKISRGCFAHGLRKSTVDHVGLQHSWTTGTDQDGGSGSVTWSSRRHCCRDPHNSHFIYHVHSELNIPSKRRDFPHEHYP